MKMESLHDLYVHELKDLHNAEAQLIKALPKMAKAATSEELRAAFEDHLAETEQQAERLEKILEELGEGTRAPKCKGMEGIIKEGEELLKKKKDAEPEALDAALIAAAQRVEHYEIAGYGTARTYAQILGFQQAANLLQQTLDEEGDTDKKLSNLAEQINVEAAQAAGMKDK
jgi:ferritin-like metal-binding protein YciE